MRRFSSAASLYLVAAQFFACGFAKAADRPTRSTPQSVDFNRDIRPILSNNCFFCHGPDPKHREADLRLDLREPATAGRDGRPAIVPGNIAESVLVERITSSDPDVVMPPPDSNKKLTPNQTELLKRWIAQGADYQSHWAYAPLNKPQPPQVKSDWPRNDIDRFLLTRLNAENLSPAAEADARTLCRRLYFDLTGLPPTAAEVEEFVSSVAPSPPPSPSAPDKGIRRGGGKEKAIEDLVDRLLASPHFGEKLAVWWLDLVRYADTVGYHGDQDVTVWPFRDYVIGAFNRNLPFDQFTREQLAGDLLPQPTRDQRVASGYNRLGMMTAEGGAQDKEYLAKYAADRVRNFSNVWLGATVGCAECHDHKFDPYTSRDFYSLAAFFADLKEKGFYGGANSSGDWGPKILLSTSDQEAEMNRLDAAMAAVVKEIDAATPDAKKQFAEWEKKYRGRSAGDLTKAPADIKAILRDESGKRNAASQDRVYAYFLELTFPKLDEQTKQLKQLQADRKKVEAAIPSMLVAEAVAPRTMRILARGNWMDDSGEVVLPAWPQFMESSKIDPQRRLTRLDLADWTVSPDNPLTARVFVNRLWAMYFGVGLSKRLDDLGAQGEPPVHPEMLDYLAAKFRDDWDVKRIVKLIVMSAAYRQASTTDAATIQRDPYNRLYARQSRFRLPAESVRDNALVVSGLLSPTIGGRSVRPYQPAGYYAQLNFPKREYQEDTGENLWRRSVYTHWQRTFLHPAMVAFDAPSREECTCERVRSNTPLQSLVLLNDPEFVEAARALAERTLRETSDPAAERVDFVFRTALQRKPTADERKLLVELYEKHRSQYAAEKADANRLLEIGARPAPTELNPAELAAWTSVCRVVLNLHEFVTRD